MTFDARGDLIEADDGGIYKRTQPRSPAGDWLSLNGDLQTAEMHDVAYDNNSKVAIGGNQDTGVPVQLLPGETLWESLLQADGGDIAIDNLTTPGISIRFSSNQNLGNFNRTFWDKTNNFLGFDFPSLVRLGGSPAPTRRFITPVTVNGVDANRLVIGFGNGIYESFDQADTITRLSPIVAVNAIGAEPLAYGAAANPDFLYAGATDRVFVRIAAPPAPLVQSLSFPGTGTGSAVIDIAIDPDDANTAFVVNTVRVFRTTNAGITWTDVTGNFQSFVPSTPRAIVYAATPAGDAVIVGTQNGIYFATAATGFTSWQRLGNGLPTVPVFDLDYDRGDDLLVAGTVGRGAWKLLDVSTAVQGGL
jgi:hypothetical protein